jgi:hypothetical protein
MATSVKQQNERERPLGAERALTTHASVVTNKQTNKLPCTHTHRATEVEATLTPKQLGFTSNGTIAGILNKHHNIHSG